MKIHYLTALLAFCAVALIPEDAAPLWVFLIPMLCALVALFLLLRFPINS